MYLSEMMQRFTLMGNNNTNMYPNDKSPIGAYPALKV